MKTNEISELVKTSLNPAGELYLTRAKAIQLIRWLEVTERAWKQQEESMVNLNKLLKPLLAMKGDS